MARGFVKKRGDVWYAYWRAPDGRQRAKSIGTRKKDAEAFLNQLQAQLQAGVYKELKDATFAVFVDRWLADYAEASVRPSTLYNYRSIVRTSLLPFFGDQRLEDIEPEDVQRFMAGTLKRVSPNTVRKHLILLKTILQHAVMWGYLRNNPASLTKPPKVPHHEMDFLTPDEARTFLASVNDWHRPLFITALTTGMRLGELQALQWGDIQWSNMTIRVQRSVWHGRFQDPKSARSIRTLGMPPALADALMLHMTRAPASPRDLVFTTEDGKVLDQTNLRTRVFEPALRRAGLRKIRMHDLRHTSASMLINQGENLKYVQQQLGHASIQTTVDRYGHLMPDAHVGATARLQQTLFGAAAPDDRMLTPTPGMETGQKPNEPLTCDSAW